MILERKYEVNGRTCFLKFDNYFWNWRIPKHPCTNYWISSMLGAHLCSEKVRIGILSKISNHWNAGASAERNKNSSKTNFLLLHCSIIWNFKLSLDHSTSGILKLWKIYWLRDLWWIGYNSQNQSWTRPNVYYVPCFFIFYILIIYTRLDWSFLTIFITIPIMM